MRGAGLDVFDREPPEPGARVIALPETRERLEALGIDPIGMGGEGFGKLIAADIARFRAVAKAANIKADPD